jgi:phosphomannomutase
VRDSAGAAAADATAAERIIERFHRIGLVEEGSDDRAGYADIGGSRDEIRPDTEAAARQLREIGATRLHMDKVLDAIGAECAERIRERGFVVAVDSVNASGVVGARLLLQRLGCTIRHIGGEETGIFPHTPEPTRENLGGLAEEIQRRGAAVGFAQDPDGDRLAIVDERGVYIGEEYTLVLAAMALFELDLASDEAGAEGGAGASPTLCANLSTSRMIDDVAATYGARVVRSAVGEANVVAAMRERGAILGGEGNGGVIWPRVTLIRDSLSAMALVLGLMARTGSSVSELVARVPRYAIVKRKVELSRREDADPAIAAVEARWSGEPDARIDRQDGARVDFDADSEFGAAWIHVRPSNTEPIMRLIAEAGSEETACRLLDQAASATG